MQDEKRLQIGYKEEDIRVFIPRRFRTFTTIEQLALID